MTPHLLFPEFVLWRGKFWRPGRQNHLGNIGHIELLPLIDATACPVVARCEEIVCPYQEHIRLVQLWLEQRAQEPTEGVQPPPPLRLRALMAHNQVS